MIDESSRDRLIAKIQYFADMIEHNIDEKEALVLALDDSTEKKDVQRDILICKEMLEMYHDVFKEIIYR